MWFINGKRQVIELKRSTQEKRARRMATRPEPTIIGNCDSWSFIVGKKPAGKSPYDCIQGELPGCNRAFIHNLFTVCTTTTLDNLWVSCGSAVHCTSASRIVNPRLANIQISVEQEPLFYRIQLIDLEKVSKS
ncbi:MULTISPECIES: hypothetical protein [unclassified Acidovorax]|uniref:hypothetical protein n=1 Tax=unclassified Acidovorax TaxID=2684926 RepID=UPI001C44DE16|nr:MULTISPECIES: hypothetical protein [unclassified Acidovorax]MBV7427605.1 hypothetical protein [Acidovorax sp. sif0732]MBV7449965.1 hypothetical protein [Acidovorax sp. sif0715]